MSERVEDRTSEISPRGNSRLLTFAAGALLALLAMEAVVRQVYSITFVLEPGFGYIRTYARYRLEGNGTSRWTVFDIRRAEPPVPSKPSILVLGDSFTEAMMVGDDEVYSAILERDLNGAGLEVQVLNLGISGASVADYVAYAPLYRRLFSPRWTVVQLRTSDLTTDAWDSGKTHFVRAGIDGGLEVRALKPHFEEVRDNPWKQMVRGIPSMLLHHGLGRFSEFVEGAAAETPLFLAGNTDGSSRRQADEAEDSYPVEDEMDLLARSYDGRVTYLLLPRYDPDRPLAPEGWVERRFEEHCARSGMSCVNLRNLYPEFKRNRRSPFGFSNTAFNSGHMNAQGHGAAAAELASEMGRLRSRGLL